MTSKVQEFLEGVSKEKPTEKKTPVLLSSNSRAIVDRWREYVGSRTATVAKLLEVADEALEKRELKTPEIQLRNLASTS